jgi:hypothetical protein
LRVVHLVAGGLQLDLGAHYCGARVGLGEQRRFELGLGNALELEELLGAFELGRRRLQLCPCHLQVRVRLRHLVARCARIDARQQLPRLDIGAGPASR